MPDPITAYGPPIHIGGVLSEPDYCCLDCKTLYEFTPDSPAFAAGETVKQAIFRRLRERPLPDIDCPECGGEIRHRSEVD